MTIVTAMLTNEQSKAPSTVSLSAHQHKNKVDFNPPKVRWTAEQARIAVDKLVQFSLQNNLDPLALKENIEKLSEDSRWKKTDLQKQYQETLKIKSNQHANSIQNLANTKELANPAAKAEADKLRLETNIFTVFQHDLERLGYPVEQKFASSILMALTSRFLDRSTGHIIYGDSSSGKSGPFMAALNFLEETNYQVITSTSQQGINYLGDVKNVLLAFGEIKPSKDGEDDARQMAMRQLLSENKLYRVIPEKQANGRIENSVKITEGPAVIVASTTCDPQSFNDEFLNRCFWIPSDDSEETTKRVKLEQAARASKPQNYKKDDAELIQAKWQIFNSTLEPLEVSIPFAQQIIPTSNHVTVRRALPLLYSYIKLSCLLHQHSRKSFQENGITMLIADKEDYKIAIELFEQNAPRPLENCTKKSLQDFEMIKKSLENLRVFTRKNVEELLKKGKATANRNLNQWLQEGLIQIVDKSYGGGKLTKYEFLGDKALRQEIGLMSFDELLKCSPAQVDEHLMSR